MPGGYGRMRMWRDGKHAQTPAHRISWMLEHGELPPREVFVCHRCDTPRCVRPDHLFLGSHADNMADMAAKGRSTVGVKNPKCKLTPVQVEEIRARRATGETLSSIAVDYGVSLDLVSRIELGKVWKTSTITEQERSLIRSRIVAAKPPEPFVPFFEDMAKCRESLVLILSDRHLDPRQREMLERDSNVARAATALSRRYREVAP